MSIGERLERLDHRQQGSRRIGFVAAVVKKFSDDQAGQLAALISYYGFVSLFPLMLVFVTILGFVLEDNPHERDKILNGVLGQFPIVSDQLKFHSLSGSAPALAIGLVFALLAGLGIMNASQSAFNRIWNVPFKQRPNWVSTRLRGLGDAGPAGHARDRLHGRGRLRRLELPRRRDRGGRRGGGAGVQPRPLHAGLQTAHGHRSAAGASCFLA